MELGIETWISEVTGATSCWDAGVVQNLWSGYGSIQRYGLEGSERASVIVKRISPSTEAKDNHHPRGWNTDRSHQRKLKSYQVEAAWYQNYAARNGLGSRVPQCLAVERQNQEIWLLLEDLDASGFSERRSVVTSLELHACLSWLASFHATFLGSPADGLWECGTYWHLETRPDELEQLQREDLGLWKAAAALDDKLKKTAYQTLVHGDAKLANFCFSRDLALGVAAVDFQYVGRGCGMKDVAYFIGSCLEEEECEKQVPTLLDLYFKELRSALAESNAGEIDVAALESEWRSLFPIAWTDFHRFLKGWSPGHWKIHSYSERLSREVLAQLALTQEDD
ncbi:MAG: phosphotransferase [Verrucomicrobiota bacterium]